MCRTEARKWIIVRVETLELASTNFEELDTLLDNLVDIGLTSVEHERLAGLLRSDLNARRQYVSFVTLHAHLDAEWGNQIPQMVQSERAGRKADGERDELRSRNRSIIRPESLVRDPSLHSSICDDQPFSQSPPAPTFLSATIPSTVGFFSSGWPVAYLIATVIFGIGLVVGGVVRVSQPVQIVEQTQPVAKVKSVSEPKTEFVGRITGMVDCQWAQGSGFRGQGTGAVNLPSPSGRRAGGEGGGESDSPLSTLHSPLIRLGDTFALRSGLMEITYDTGAKVILQGPVKYEVEAKNGGFMTVGKLTARVEKKGNKSPLARRRERGRG